MNIKDLFGTFAPQPAAQNDPLFNRREAGWSAAGGALQGLGIGLMTGDWAKAMDVNNSAVDEYRQRKMQKYTAQQLMEEAAARKAEREQAQAEIQRKNEWLKGISDPKMRATLEANPGLIDNYIMATDPTFQKPEKPQLYEVNGKLVRADGSVAYDGTGGAGVKWKETTLDDGVYWVDENNPGNRIKVGERPNRNEGEGRSFTQETKLRAEYTTEAKPFTDLRTNYQKIAASSSDQTGASDIALVYSFMKMLDPTSVVREGEFATAANAGGVDSKIMSLYNQVLNGQKLSPQVRADFVQQAGRQYDQQIKTYGKIRSKYIGLAEKLGLDPMNVAPDLTYGILPIGDPASQNAPPEVNSSGKGNLSGKPAERPPEIAPDIWELMTEEDRALWQR